MCVSFHLVHLLIPDFTREQFAVHTWTWDSFSLLNIPRDAVDCGLEEKAEQPTFSSGGMEKYCWKWAGTGTGGKRLWLVPALKGSELQPTYVPARSECRPFTQGHPLCLLTWAPTLNWSYHLKNCISADDYNASSCYKMAQLVLQITAVIWLDEAPDTPTLCSPDTVTIPPVPHCPFHLIALIPWEHTTGLQSLNMYRKMHYGIRSDTLENLKNAVPPKSSSFQV